MASYSFHVLELKPGKNNSYQWYYPDSTNVPESFISDQRQWWMQRRVTRGTWSK